MLVCYLVFVYVNSLFSMKDLRRVLCLELLLYEVYIKKSCFFFVIFVTLFKFFGFVCVLLNISYECSFSLFPHLSFSTQVMCRFRATHNSLINASKYISNFILFHGIFLSSFFLLLLLFVVFYFVDDCDRDTAFSLLFLFFENEFVTSLS